MDAINLIRYRAEAIDWRSSADECREELNVATPVFRDPPFLNSGNQRLAAGRSPEAMGSAESRECCAYNVTRERFLGVDVDAGDFTVASLDDRIPKLAPRSGAGLWLVPFRGISATSVHVPLDLIYLDRSCTVIDVVESFPIFRVSASSPPAASVLVLPSHSIESTGTQPGDELIVCAPEEMKRRLQRLSSLNDAAPSAQDAAPVREELLRSPAPNVLQWEDRSRLKRPDEERLIGDRSPSQQSQGTVLAEPETKNVKPAKSWWQRLLSPDPPQPRKADRESFSGLAAYFWTGGAPVQHVIQDISPTGLYVVTDERWYPGTVVRMTLTDAKEPTAERSITVNATSVRWGNDGVGLRFVFQDEKDLGRGLEQVVGGISKKQLDQFLQPFRNSVV
jgi:hypothetical protein